MKFPIILLLALSSLPVWADKSLDIESPQSHPCNPPDFLYQGACWKELSANEDCSGEVLIAHLEDQPVYCRRDQVVPLDDTHPPTRHR